MQVKILISQMFKNVIVTKELLDATIGKPVNNDKGEVIGKITGYNLLENTICADIDVSLEVSGKRAAASIIDDFDGDLMCEFKL